MSMTGFSGSDDVLACFAAGNAFSWDDWFRKETEEAHFQEVIDMLLNLSIFVYIGAIIVSQSDKASGHSHTHAPINSLGGLSLMPHSVSRPGGWWSLLFLYLYFGGYPLYSCSSP